VSDHVAERISAFLDGELEENERTGVVRHLEACAECNARLEELAAVDRLAASVPVEAPEGYFDRFASRVRDRIRKPARRRIVAPAWLLTAAAAVLLAVTVPVLLRRQIEVAHRDVPAAGALAPPPPTTASAPTTATLPPEAQDSLRATGYVGLRGRLERKRDDAPVGRGRERAKAPALDRDLKDERAGAPPPAPLDTQTPAPAALPPAAEPLPQSRANAEREADQDAGAAALEERKQRAEGSTQSAGAFASRPESVEESTAVEAAQAPKRALQKVAPSAAFRALLARQATTIAEARGLREAWRAFAQGAAEGEADEARVRVIEAGQDAYRLSGEKADRDQLRRDADAYLKRADARQRERVRALLRVLPR
jgi:putative zinc finger protein